MMRCVAGVTIILTLSACEKVNPFHNAAEAAESRHAQPLAQPIVFARYADVIDLPGEATLSSQPCLVSKSFLGPNSVCGPQPLLAGQDLELNVKAKLVPWKLSKTPEYFYWEQAVKADNHLVVELIDGDGLPWPASSAEWQRNGVSTVRVKPTHELPKLREIVMSGSVFDATGKKIQTWTAPLAISDGLEGATPWKPVAPIRQAKRPHPRR